MKSKPKKSARTRSKPRKCTAKRKGRSCLLCGRKLAPKPRKRAKTKVRACKPAKRRKKRMNYEVKQEHEVHARLNLKVRLFVNDVEAKEVKEEKKADEKKAEEKKPQAAAPAAAPAAEKPADKLADKPADKPVGPVPPTKW